MTGKGPAREGAKKEEFFTRRRGLSSEAAKQRRGKARRRGEEKDCAREGAKTRRKKKGLTQRRSLSSVAARQRRRKTQRCCALESGRASTSFMIAPAARRIFRREAPSSLFFRRCGFVHRFGIRRDDKSGRGDAVPGPHIRHLCVSAPLRESFLLSSRLRAFACTIFLFSAPPRLPPTLLRSFGGQAASPRAKNSGCPEPRGQVFSPPARVAVAAAEAAWSSKPGISFFAACRSPHPPPGTSRVRKWGLLFFARRRSVRHGVL